MCSPPAQTASGSRFVDCVQTIWVRVFASVEELRQALLEFQETYNANWLIERHGFRPPRAIREDQLSTAALAA